MWWPIAPWLVWPGLAFAAAVAIGLGLRALLLAAVRRWAGPANGQGPFLAAVRLPSFLWVIVLGLYVAVEVASDYERLPRRLSQDLALLLQAAIILSVTVTVAHVAVTLIARVAERRALGGPVTGLAQAAARMAILIVGILVLLGALGVQITPLLTALGVGGLAVSLALQDTLSNLFAGFHLLADRPMRVGDWVRIAEGIEGQVVDVGWRSTRIRSLQNTVVVVPNAKIAQSVLLNYTLPDSRMALSLRVSVSYASAPDRVAAVLVEEATRAIGELPGLLEEPPPAARLIPGFGESSLDFTLAVQVASYLDQYAVQDGLRRRILRRFRSEGIEIPFPVRTVQVRPTPAGP